jgi:hypothetical protein
LRRVKRQFLKMLHENVADDRSGWVGPGQSPRHTLTPQGFSRGNSACGTRRLLVTYSGPLRRARLVIQCLHGFLPVPRWAKTEGWSVNFYEPSYLESHSRMELLAMTSPRYLASARTA